VALCRPQVEIWSSGCSSSVGSCSAAWRAGELRWRSLATKALLQLPISMLLDEPCDGVTRAHTHNQNNDDASHCRFFGSANVITVLQLDHNGQLVSRCRILVCLLNCKAVVGGILLLTLEASAALFTCLACFRPSITSEGCMLMVWTVRPSCHALVTTCEAV
jgi:hypothetical protein